MGFKRVFGFVVFFACVCVANGASPAGNSQRLIDENLGFSTTDPTTLEKIRKIVGPAKESSEPVSNPHVAGQIDRIVKLKSQSGVYIRTWVTAAGPALIMKIDVTGARVRIKLPLGLQIGKTSLTDAVKLLGEGVHTKSPLLEFLRYDCTFCGLDQSALLSFDEHKRLAEIEWTFEID